MISMAQLDKKLPLVESRRHAVHFLCEAHPLLLELRHTERVPTHQIQPQTQLAKPLTVLLEWQRKDTQSLMTLGKCIIGIILIFFRLYSKQLVEPLLLANICGTALLCRSSKQSDCSMDYIQKTHTGTQTEQCLLLESCRQQGKKEFQSQINTAEHTALLVSLQVVLKLQLHWNNNRKNSHDANNKTNVHHGQTMCTASDNIQKSRDIAVRSELLKRRQFLKWRHYV